MLLLRGPLTSSSREAAVRSVGRLGKPFRVPTPFFNIDQGEILDGILALRSASQWRESQLGSGFLNVEPGWQPEQGPRKLRFHDRNQVRQKFFYRPLGVLGVSVWTEILRSWSSNTSSLLETA
jgi:hypothetical protein